MWRSLIVAGIGALIGAIGGAVAQGQKNKEAREQAQNQKNYIEETYNLNKKKADIEFLNARNEAVVNASYQRSQADLLDKNTNIAEKSLSTDFNLAIDNLYSVTEGDAYDYNAQAMQIGAASGAAYSNLGASGVRANSSLSDAVLMESAVNESQLQFAQDSKRRSVNNSLISVLNQVAGNTFNIKQNRIAADWQRSEARRLVDSYSLGGANYNLYQNQLELLKANTDYNTTQVNYVINQNSGTNAYLKNAAAALTGGTAGFQTGYNLANTAYQAANYKKGGK